jgi:serine O-acetyltransferase
VNVKIPIMSSLSRAEVGRFLRLVREDLEAHDGDWTRAGFQALLVYRFGVWRMSIETRLIRAPFSVLWRALFAAVRNFYGIELPFTARVGRRVIFEHQHGIVVHGNTEIGDDCIIRQGVTLGIRRLDRLKEAPVLGKGVNVGAGAKILGHVLVGDHAEIGANSVVLENVPPYTLAVGIPAHNVPRNDKRRMGRRERAARGPGGAPGSVRGAGNGLTTNGASSASNGPPSNGPGSTLAGVRTN